MNPPVREGVVFQVAPFPSDRRLLFAAHDTLKLLVRFEADGSFEETPCNAVVLNKDGVPINNYLFTDRRRTVKLFHGSQSASGELDFQLAVSDFEEVLDCHEESNLEAKLNVEFLNGSKGYIVSATDDWQIVVDGAPPEIVEHKTESLPDLVLSASIVARDELSGVARVQMALSPKNKPALTPEDFQLATLANGRYVVQFPTAEIEPKVRSQPHHLYAIAEDEVGNRTERDFRNVMLPKPVVPPPATPAKEPDNTPAPGVFFGQLLYPSGVPARDVKLGPQSPNPQATTAADGTFTFERLQAGKEYPLRVLHTVSGKSYEISASLKAVTAKELPKEPVRLFLQEARKGLPKL
jgi:hypothetical protein